MFLYLMFELGRKSIVYAIHILWSTKCSTSLNEIKSTDQRHKAISMTWQGRQREANSKHLSSDQVNLPGSAKNYVRN